MEVILNGTVLDGYGYANLDEIEDFEYNFVDSSYPKIIFDFGLIFSCIILLGYRAILVENYNKKNYWLVLTIFFVLAWSFVEQYIVNIGKNVFALALIPLLEIGKINKLNYENLKNRAKNNKFLGGV